MSATTTASRLVPELRAICGAEYVVEDPAELQQRAILGVAPTVAVAPGSGDEIAAIVRFANEDGLTVVPAGGFTQQDTGRQPGQVDVLLCTSRLTEVEHYDPGDLTVGVGAGSTVAGLTARVAADKLFFAGDPTLPERATVGGLLATGLYGPHRHGYGGLRDYCIGIRFVTGDGRKAKGGGRVVKNVAGYDMMKLLIGSWGTLGIITSASFKLFPAPRQTRTFVALFSSAAEALEFRYQVLRSPLDPICLEIVSPQAHKLLVPASPAGTGWSICIRATGSDAVLARYRTELGSTVVREIEGANERGLWRRIADFSSIAREKYPNSLLFSLTLPLRDVQAVLADFMAIAESIGFTLGAMGRVGVGHLLVGLWPEENADVAIVNYVDSVSTLCNRLPHGVNMTVLHCPAEARDQLTMWQQPAGLESMRAVKQALDPRDILNRGRFPL